MKDLLPDQDRLTSAHGSIAGFRLSSRRLLWIGGLAVVTIVALLAMGDAPTTFRAIQHANWGYIGLALLIHYSGFAVRGHRWKLLLDSTGHRVTYVRATIILLGGWFVSALLPARLGDVFRIAALRLPQRSSDAVPVADGLGSIILERALDITALLLLSATFGYLALGESLPAWVTTVYLVALSILLLLLLVLIIAPGILVRIQAMSNTRWWTATLDFALRTIDSLRTLPAHPRVAIITVAESLYIWLCDVFLLWLVLAAVGVPITLANAGFAALTVDISASVPLTPGGMGQIEAAYSALLALLAVAPTGISSAVLLARLITYWSFLLFSGIVTFASGLGGIILGRPDPASDANATNPYPKSS